MAKKSRSGNSYKAQYTAYKSSTRWKKNKERKLLKRLKENPNDTGAEKALKILSTKVYSRNKFGNKGWYHPQEQKLLLAIKENKENKDVLVALRQKLSTLKYIYLNTKPTALKDKVDIIYPDTIPDQLYKLGLINEQRYNSVKSRVGSIR